MFILNAFVDKVSGKNGCVLINNETGEVLDLSNEETIILENIMKNNINESKFKEYLIEKGWGIESNQSAYCEKLYSYKMETHGMTDFSLNKVLIELSGTCGLDCVFCDPNSNKAFASCSCKRWNYDAEEIDYSNIIKQILIYNVQKIMIIGGDPFFYAYFKLKNVLSELKRQGYLGEIVIITNGSCINKEKVLYLSEYKNVRVNVIFLGTNEEEYRKITGKRNIYRKVVNSVKLLKNYNVKVNGTLLLNNFNMTNLEQSYLNLLDIDIGIKFVFDENFNSHTLLFSRQNRTIKPDYQTSKILKETNCCLYSQLFIASDLKIYPCPYLREFCLGNANNEKLFNILKRGDYREFWFISKKKIKGCNQCKYNTICLDCRAVEYGVINDLYGEYYCNELSKIKE